MFDTLFDDLMSICNNPETGFYYVDHEYKDEKYRVFSYRLVGSYANFLLPNAINCRGTMFRKNDDGWELVCLPMQKFFRVDENPLTMNLPKEDDWLVFDKLDGSLISTFLHKDGTLDVKSKTSLSSQHTIVARSLLEKDLDLAHLCQNMERLGWTVNMELISDNPDLRIVVKYNETKLRILNFRNRVTGSIQFLTNDQYGVVGKTMKLTEAINLCNNMTNKEGFVAFNPSTQQFVKMKCAWYDVLHQAKSNLGSVDHVIRAILNESIDDFKAIFHDDIGVIKRVNNVEKSVVPVYNAMMYKVDTFYAENRDLDRKSYAIKAKQECNDVEFLIAINKYLNRPVDVTEFLIKNKNKYFNIQETFSQQE